MTVRDRKERKKRRRIWVWPHEFIGGNFFGRHLEEEEEVEER